MRKRIAEALFWLHVVLVVVWIIPYVFHTTPWMIPFHLWFTAGIVVHWVISGLAVRIMWSKSFGLVCPLTLLVQYLRGIPFYKKENYRHSFVQELLERLGWKVSIKIITTTIFPILVVGVLLDGYLLR